MKYVVGFVFDEYLGRVALLKRLKEPFSGHLNGIGGKVEAGETPKEAMQREWQEESLSETRPPFYEVVKPIVGEGFELHVFTAFLEAGTLKLPVSINEGTIDWYSVDEVIAGAAGLLADDVTFYLQESTLVHLIHS